MSFNGTSVGSDVPVLSDVEHAFDEETGRVERARLFPRPQRDPGLAAPIAGHGAGDL